MSIKHNNYQKLPQYETLICSWNLSVNHNINLDFWNKHVIIQSKEYHICYENEKIKKNCFFLSCFYDPTQKNTSNTSSEIKQIYYPDTLNEDEFIIETLRSLYIIKIKLKNIPENLLVYIHKEHPIFKFKPDVVLPTPNSSNNIYEEMKTFNIKPNTRFLHSKYINYKLPNDIYKEDIYKLFMYAFENKLWINTKYFYQKC